MRARRLIFAMTAALLFVGTAHAQNKEALKHFERGRALRGDNKCAEAIPEFERSNAAERSIGALYNLGYCYDKVGRKRAALEAYDKALELARERNDDRQREIFSQRGYFLRDSPHLVFRLPTRPPELRILVDDEAVPLADHPGEEFYFFPQKPGPHVVEARAPGFEVYRVTNKDGDTVVVTLREPPLGAEPILYEEPWGAQRWIGVATGGVGLVATGIFAFLLVEHLSEVATLEKEAKIRYDARISSACQTGTKDERDQCRFAIRDEENRPIGDENASARPAIIATAAVGFVLLAAGTVLFLTDSPKKIPVQPKSASLRVMPSLAPSQPGLFLTGTF